MQNKIFHTKYGIVEVDPLAWEHMVSVITWAKSENRLKPKYQEMEIDQILEEVLLHRALHSYSSYL